MATTADKIDQVEIFEAEQVKEDDVFIENTIEEKKLLRKIDLWLLPTIWLLYMVSYMVKIHNLSMVVAQLLTLN